MFFFLSDMMFSVLQNMQTNSPAAFFAGSTDGELTKRFSDKQIQIESNEFRSSQLPQRDPTADSCRPCSSSASQALRMGNVAAAANLDQTALRSHFCFDDHRLHRSFLLFILRRGRPAVLHKYAVHLQPLLSVFHVLSFDSRSLRHLCKPIVKKIS
jgi:hypothetical protein